MLFIPSFVLEFCSLDLKIHTTHCLDTWNCSRSLFQDGGHIRVLGLTCNVIIIVYCCIVS